MQNSTKKDFDLYKFLSLILLDEFKKLVLKIYF